MNRPAAGKTGTTDNFQDAWFIGYTPDLVTAVWVGCDDNERMPEMYGGTTPAAIWKAFMTKALSDTKASNFQSSSGGSGESVAEVHTDLDKEKSLQKDTAKDDAKSKEQGNAKKDVKTEESKKSNSGDKHIPAAPQETPVQPEQGEQNGKGQN